MKTCLPRPVAGLGYVGLPLTTAFSKLLPAAKMRGVKNPFDMKGKFDAVILAVPHRVFLDTPPEASSGLMRNGGHPAVFDDVKGVYGEASQNNNIIYWSL